MIPRLLAKPARALAKKFPVVAITGPRQSGKTTLAKEVFPQIPYVSLESPDTLERALNDPRWFLESYPKGAVLDEVQRAPKLFSYIQEIVDENQRNGMFILTGSQQFDLLSRITQSLAGRVVLLNLLPFSYAELKNTAKRPKSIEESLYQGFYPRLYHHSIKPEDWFANYIRTYIERDVRLIKNIDDLSTFQRFLKMCAARTGQVLNLSSLGNDCGISHNTAKSWLTILEASYIVFLLQPHHKNFNKRLIKSPKLYFWDTGLVCHLLNVPFPRDLTIHPKRGDIFETWVVSELMKQYLNKGKRPSLYFWQDKNYEVDVIIERGADLIPIEIKSGKTLTQDYFKNLHYWCQLAQKDTKQSILIYAGEEIQKRSLGQVYGWNQLPQLPT